MDAIITLKSKIFNKQQRLLIGSQVAFRAAKYHKTQTKVKMIAGPHTGELYYKGRGVGFRRLHQASARGQRPSPDTLTLVNAVSDRRLDTFKYEVFIAPNSYPSGQGPSADVVAEILQSYLDRPIQTLQDAQETQLKQNEYAQEAIRQLL